VSKELLEQTKKKTCQLSAILTVQEIIMDSNALHIDAPESNDTLSSEQAITPDSGFVIEIDDNSEYIQGSDQ